MICDICKKYYSIDLDFLTLFQKQTICPSCLSLSIPDLAYSVIPYDDGLLHYYSLYYFENMDYLFEKKMESRLFQILNQLLQTSTKFDFILLLTNIDFETFSNWFVPLKSFPNICLISLNYVDLSRFMNIL